MKLTKLSYITDDWELIDLDFDQINLIVAKNGTGKSRTLEVIQNLIKIFTQKSDRLGSSRWDLTFISSTEEVFNYIFETRADYKSEDKITYESLRVDNTELINRLNESEASVFNALSKEQDVINPPTNKLSIQINRDIKKYPYIEKLCTWAEESYGCLFANVKSYSKTSEKEYFQSHIGDHSIPALFELLNENSKSKLINEINNIGFSLKNISVWKTERSIYLMVEEDGLDRPIFHFQLAQGMLRTLFILIYIEYLVTQKKPALIAIDDFCEGLDFERATKLGKLVFEKCNNSNVQLIVTSNDSFLMEVVDIKYWNVLQRKGKVVTALNIKNHPKIFEDFRFTGLSNFDFFSSDFLNREFAS